MAASRRTWLTRLAVLAALAALVGGWWWRHTANERHVTGLIDMAYDYADLPDGPPHTFSYFRTTFADGSGCPGADENWFGSIAARSRLDDDVDWQARAEPAALRFEQEGWNVVRWLDSTTNADIPEFVAWKGDDHIRMSFSTGDVQLSASSGPCLRNVPPEPDAGARVVEVDHFDE